MNKSRTVSYRYATHEEFIPYRVGSKDLPRAVASVNRTEGRDTCTFRICSVYPPESGLWSNDRIFSYGAMSRLNLTEIRDMIDSVLKDWNE